jgi:alcohol dehydrogenase
MSLFATTRSPRNVVFGRGQRGAVAGYTKALGTKVLICTDERLGSDPELAKLVDSLRAAGLQTKVFDKTAPEVPLSSIADAVEIGKAFGPDVVIGFGGGSCLDMAKVTAVVLTHGGSPRDYFGEFKVPGVVIPVIAIPTTAGTGSEVTPVAVVADAERALKVGIASPHIIPHTAICDPELTFTCPPGLTAIAGADALTHAIEAFTAAPREAGPEITHQHVFLGKNALSDSHALVAIGHLARHLETAVKNGSDVTAREGVMFGAMTAGLAFGTAGTAAAHAIQYPVGALTHTAHGAGVACLLPYVMEYNLPGCTPELAQIADTMGVKSAATDQLSRAYSAIDAVTALFASIGIPKDLQVLGLPADKRDWTAEQSMGAARLVKNNPRVLDVTAMQTIISAAYSGDRLGLRNKVKAA